MKIKALLDRIDQFLLTIFKWLCVTLFVILTIIITGNVFVRYVPVMSLHWLDEIVELSFAWMVFFGSAAVWILKGHFSAGDWISRLLHNPRAKAAYRLIVDLITFVFIAVFFLVLQTALQSSHGSHGGFRVSQKSHICLHADFVGYHGLVFPTIHHRGTCSDNHAEKGIGAGLPQFLEPRPRRLYVRGQALTRNTFIYPRRRPP
jgi:TRAP-type mannitol/chloroaromatic compound transport system permease small subunit